MTDPGHKSLHRCRIRTAGRIAVTRNARWIFERYDRTAELRALFFGRLRVLTAHSLVLARKFNRSCGKERTRLFEPATETSRGLVTLDGLGRLERERRAGGGRSPSG